MINNRIIFAIIMSSIIFGQNLSEKPRKPFMNTDDISFLGTSNRITSILDEAKQFLSDAIIADVNLDTVEVVYIRVRTNLINLKCKDKGPSKTLKDKETIH
jgi:membrane-bound lytic murein transglycosylase D